MADKDPVQVLAVDEDGAAAETLLDALGGGDGIAIVTEVEGQKVTLAEAERLVRDGDYPMALVIPSDYTERARARGRAQTGVIADPSASSQTMQPLALVPVTLALALCAVSLGVLLAAYARTDAQVLGLGTILILVLAALGGCMVPLVFMPDFMSDLAAFTPHGQALIAFQDVMVRGAGVVDVLPATGILTGLAVLFFVVALPRFRFRT